MSNDLISRKKVLELIRPRLNVTKEGTLEQQRIYSIFVSIEDLPTAYDVDKVVEQLESFKACYESKAAAYDEWEIQRTWK